jgi:SNF2 family DNA or RNA helicase
MLEFLANFAGASQALMKSADILSPLEPHQQRVVDKFKNNNLLVAHGMGSGKTLSSIAAAESTKGPVEIFTPASITHNYEKEIQKHTGGNFVPYKVHSIATASGRNHQIEPGSTMIVDEAHLARNPETDKTQYLKEQAQRAGKVMLLTGTPTYNQPENLAPLVNIMSRGTVLPESPQAFRSRYIEDVQVNPGMLARWAGAKPGTVQRLKNKHELVAALRGKVDVFEQQKNMPKRVEKDVDVEMSPEQQRVYNWLEQDLPPAMRAKIKWNLPPSKTESQQLNAFSTGLRQASNTPGPYMHGTDHLQSAMLSPKLQSAMGSIKENMNKDPNFRGFVYSNYMDAGTLPMAALMRRENIPFAIYHGGLNPKEKKQIVDDYNTGKLKVMLGTSAATEGLDLKGTKLIQVLEPHFNESKTEQAIARGIRFGSHAHLPEPERQVMVERYYSKPQQGFFSRLFTGERTGIDRYLRQRALEKAELSRQIREALMEASK